MKQLIITLAAALTAASATAAAITPTSYSMPNGNGQASGGQFNYWDLGYTGSGNTSQDNAVLSGGLGDLTDGVVSTLNWFAAENAAGTGPYVGWRVAAAGLAADPTVTFFFAGAQDIDTIQVHADDSAAAGGVNLPSQVLITWAGGSLSLAVTDPDAGSQPSWLTFSGLGITNASSVSVQFIHANEWVFVDEVTFDGGNGTVPLPATWSLVALGLATGWRRRR
jgi:MYXO-CTERM domain-containing protein